LTLSNSILFGTLPHKAQNDKIH